MKEVQWAELSGEQARLRVTFSEPLGQAHPGHIRLEIEGLTADQSVQLVTPRAFEQDVRSLQEQRDGATALLEDLFNDFSLRITRTGSDEFAVSAEVSERATNEYDLRARFDVTGAQLQSFTAGLRQLTRGAQ